MPPIIINEKGDVRTVASTGAGDVFGPATSTDNAIARYDGTDGKHVQDSDVTVDDAGVVSFPSTGGVTTLKLIIGGYKGIFTHANNADRTYTFPNYNGDIATLAGAESFSNKTLITPTIASLINAQHSHQNAAGGGQLNASSVFSAGLLPLTYGGSGADLSATGGANKAVWQESAGAPFTVRVIANNDLPTTFTGKTIDGDDNTVQDLPLTSIKTVGANTKRFITRDTSGVPVDTANPPLDNLQHDHSNAANGGQLNAGTVFSAGLVPLARGGTHTDLSATGGSNKVVMQESVGADFTVRVLASGDIPNLDASKITSGNLALARGGSNADLSGAAGNRKVLTLFSGDSAFTAREYGGYIFQPWTVLGADAASISISSIPATFNKIVIEIVLRSDRAANTTDGILARINGDTTVTHYFGVTYFAQSAAPGAVNNLGGTATYMASVVLPAATATAGYYGSYTITIENYASTTQFRAVHFNGQLIIAETAGNQNAVIGGNTWKDSTNAISSLSFAPQNGSNFKAGSAYAVYLY